MNSSNCHCLLLVLFFCAAGVIYAGLGHAKALTRACIHRSSPCFLKKHICPDECPTPWPSDARARVCHMDCMSPICKPQCKRRKPNCRGPGSVCLDPRFIGGDGIVFYFHGKKDEHFSLVSDQNLQINARFIGLRPSGRNRDYTWMQALGILCGSYGFTLEATRAAEWDDEMDRLKFSYNGEELIIPEGHLSPWESPENEITVERTSTRNSAIVTLPDIVEISVNVVPVTKEDDKIHNYSIPTNDCFAHLEVEFKFYGLSQKVEGVLGRTYQPDFVNPAKPGVAMPIVGGEDKYRTGSLLSADCNSCMFSSVSKPDQSDSMLRQYNTLDCTQWVTSGYGIVCQK